MNELEEGTLESDDSDLAYSGAGAFRAMSKEVKNLFGIEKEMEMLTKNFPSVKSEDRFLEDFDAKYAGLTLHYIKADHQDLFELLICIFQKWKAGCDEVTIDEEEFVINSIFLEEKGTVEMEVRILRKDEATLVIEFTKKSGEQMSYFEKVGQLKKHVLEVFAGALLKEKDAGKEEATEVAPAKAVAGGEVQVEEE